LVHFLIECRVGLGKEVCEHPTASEGDFFKKIRQEISRWRSSPKVSYPEGHQGWIKECSMSKSVMMNPGEQNSSSTGYRQGYINP
jgi:hypothetical protein